MSLERRENLGKTDRGIILQRVIEEFLDSKYAMKVIIMIRVIMKIMKSSSYQSSDTSSDND